MRTCCVTGHRQLKDDKIEYVKTELYGEVLLAIENGYTHFISGFAESVDLYFAEIVIELKNKNNNCSSITLEAAIPYRKRLNTPNKLFKKLIEQCDKVTVISENYSTDCYMKRNKYMVEQSERVIAVFDGREKSGTAATMRFARTNKRELHTIQI